ncbi:MAG: peptidylprolyl isomerase [Saprospiraceae bacterium]|nr:peptidylprolyl isomerase [Saprospiraceae bacterium]MCF8250846.1 peptidylprolyl isomerase [Saprospiraceae bacterium]MCF8280695.1 peptidylprolyl isomerase [Bacteroidales bacterium]MCF8312753.1 peptidylprolyl isomerase [Saprospiraceae bacterium]MCF8441200.1 peptidylprolyl isomerase [Saprospiraceae bacterium]
MALIGKIRKQKWLLIATLAGALILFIGMLMFDNPNQNFFGGSQTTIGEIEGRKIEYREFAGTQEMLYANSGGDGFSDRAYLWNFFVEEAIVKKEADCIGLGVSKAELVELQFSDDDSKISPIISSRYRDQATQQLDRQQLSQLKDIVTTGKIDKMIEEKQLVPDFKYRWAHQEKEIIKDRLQRKMSSMVEKGMFTPTWMAEAIDMEQSQKVDFLYAQVPFGEIETKSVTLSDEDYKAYFEENKAVYKQKEETRKLEFVVFDVRPTAQDSADIRQGIEKLIPSFKTTDNDTVFVENNYGSLDGAYVKKSELNPAIADSVFNMPNGEVFGPYLDGNTFKAVKMVGRKSVPDSVKARHILRRASDQATLIAAQNTIDSLKALIESGAARFDSLAVRFSEDGSASKGGDLGVFQPGAMVKEFNEVCFYKAEVGKVYSVITQFGVHLIEVNQRYGGETGVRVAYISQDIVPSQATQDAVREQALQLQEDNKTLESLQKAVAAKGLTIEKSPALKANDFTVGPLSAGQGSREMVRWAFGNDQNVGDVDKGDVSPQVYSFQNQGEFYVNKYVVTGLKSIIPAGTPSWKDVKEEMEPQVINRKKAELVKQQTQGKDLASIAAQYSVQVDTATAISFASAFLPKAGGVEPKVVAAAFKVDLNKTSEPVVGSTGIFVVMPTNKTPGVASGNVAQIRQQNQAGARGGARNGLIQTLREKANVEDNRSKFF